jgi:hypothetical protein
LFFGSDDETALLVPLDDAALDELALSARAATANAASTIVPATRDFIVPPIVRVERRARCAGPRYRAPGMLHATALAIALMFAGIISAALAVLARVFVGVVEAGAA